MSQATCIVVVMTNTSWKKQAKCRGVDTAIFMPDDTNTLAGERKRLALTYCNACPVKQECLLYAIDNNITVGIYGGTTNLDRRRYKNRMKNKHDKRAAIANLTNATTTQYNQ